MKTTKAIHLFDRSNWVYSNILANVICMGLLHAPIAHGLGGAHGKELTLFQIATHTLSLWFFLSVLLLAQSRAWKAPVRLMTPANLAAFMTLVPLMFWTGYYTLYIPFDILFMYLTIGTINGWMLRGLTTRPTRWMLQMLLTGLSAAIAGIAAGLTAYSLFIKNLHGMALDITLWTTITLPASVTYGLVGKYFIVRLLESPTVQPALKGQLEVSYQQ